MKTHATPTQQNTRRSAASSQTIQHHIIQRVNNESLRDTTDPAISALKVRTVLILEQLKQGGEDWKGKWGEKAKKKAREKTQQILNNEKGESIESQVVKKIWAQLSTEEKIQVCTEAAKTAGKAVTTLLGELSLPQSSSSSSKKKSKPKKSSSSDNIVGDALLSGMEGISNLSSNDLKTMYKALKKKREFDKKVEEIKDEITDKVGLGSERAGEFVGEMRDEHDFEKLINELLPEFDAASKKFRALKKTIEDNDDNSRYTDEIAVLHNALEHILGPRIAFIYNGQINAKARLDYPKLCEHHIKEINSASRDNGMLSFLKANNGNKGDSSVPIAQEKAASALKRVVHKSWSKVTYFWSTPSGVTKLRKIGRGMEASDYLTTAKALAKGFGDGGSNRDQKVTQPFYTALADVNVTNKSSLNTATEAFKTAESGLS
ncbi:hypothetical protein [Roseivirga pacifica]|uniref:hypothetical protein n=1 Tax=Roseivirga pacifica TaxID=1267423 RepID=UPI003BAF2294